MRSALEQAPLLALTHKDRKPAGLAGFHFVAWPNSQQFAQRSPGYTTGNDAIVAYLSSQGRPWFPEDRGLVFKVIELKSEFQPHRRRAVQRRQALSGQFALFRQLFGSPAL